MATKTKNARLTVYVGTAAQWAATSVVLLKGEIGLETDTNLFKFGDGTSAYPALPYANDYPKALADFVQDASHRLVTDAQIASWNAKQNALTFDSTPTQGSANPVTSGGVYASESVLKATQDGIISDLNELKSTVSQIPKFSIQVVESLPTTNISTTTLYLLKTSTTETGNLYTEYIYVDGKWESLGTQTLDLSDYATKTYADNAASAAQANAKTYTDGQINGLATIAKSGKLADGTQDATHRLVTDTEKSTWNGKQNALTFDNTPTSGSTNPVTSGGVFSALAGKANSADIIKVSTGLTDSADLMRYSDTLIIDGGSLS